MTSTENELSRSEQTYRWHWRRLIIATALILALPAWFQLLHVPPVDLAENRLLAEWPKWPTWSKSLSGWAEYFKRLDGYVQDHFPPRRHFIAWSNAARYRLGSSGAKNVIVGRDGWLFYNDGSDFAFHRNRRLEEPEVGRWVTSCSQKAAQLRAAGIPLYVLFPPVKPTVYPEKMPRWLPPLSATTELDQLLEAARAKGLDFIVDCRPALLNGKHDQQLYPGYETHWNSAGAFHGYQMLMNRMAQDCPALKPYPIEHYPQAETPAPCDLASMLGIARFIQLNGAGRISPIQNQRTVEFLGNRQTWVDTHVIRTGANTGRTLLLVRDSFSTHLLPYLENHFDRIIVAHLQNGFWRQDLIDQFHPDVVLLEVIETGARHAF
jgi:alginate O-acetyltransferase complex protein AlgJ